MGLLSALSALHWWRALSVATVFLVWLLIGKKDAFVFFAFALAGVIFFSTWLNDGSMELWRRHWLANMLVVLSFNVFMEKRRNELVRAFFIISGAICIANLVSVAFFPDGLYEPNSVSPVNFFYGNRVLTFEFIIPFVVCSMLLDSYCGKCFSARTLVAVGLSLFQVFVLQSITARIALVFLLCLSAVMRFGIIRRMLNIWTIFGANALFFGLFVVGRFEHLFAPVISGIFKKSVTLTGRTVIWDAVVALMEPRYWLFGRGMFRSRFYVEGCGQIWHAHNLFLEMWMRGGFAAIVCLISLFVLAGINLFRTRDSYAASLIVAAIAAFLLAGLSDPAYGCGLYFFLAMGYYGLVGSSPKGSK